MSADKDPIAEQVWQRRAALHAGPVKPGRPWGLALSGGGIRSATFCFGLLHALAAKGLLLRFDLLSTVSGGGYIGAMLGALFHRARNAADVRAVAQALADAPSRWFAWWLRANGRYLVPRGTRDLTFAVALFLRNLIGVHLELGTMALLLGVALAVYDTGAWHLLDRVAVGWATALFGPGRPVLDLLQPLPASLLLLLPLLAMGAVVAMAYWTMPWVMRQARVLPLWPLAPRLRGLRGVRRLRRPLARLRLQAWGGRRGALSRAGLLWRVLPYWLLALVALPLGARLLVLVRPDAEGAVQRLVLLASGLGLLAMWWLAVPLAAWVLFRTPANEAPGQRGDRARNRLTRWLANGLRVALVVAGLGALDRLAWYLAFEGEAAIEGLGLLLGVLAVLGRAALPLLSGAMGGGASLTVLLPLGRLLGYALTFVLTAWWMSLVYRAGLGALFQRGPEPLFDALGVLAAIGLPALGYLVITGRYLDFLNLSSLHGFYRARLVRSYLGAANAERFKGLAAPLGTLAPLPAALLPEVQGVSEVHTGDDLAFADYRPQQHGGPVHLINSCINQTRDPRGGLFNQDRRGLALTLASGGWAQVSREGWKQLDDPHGPTLGGWVAISGAAVAPGLGSMTRGGVSALATFAGLRLGYWWRRRGVKARPGEWCCAKSRTLLRETFGRFRGTERRDWFLTDGGHFENTAAYALMAERAELIVLADCGADPEYRFGDLENLVRKARIDLQAEVVFQRPLAAAPGDAAAPPAPAAGVDAEADDPVADPFEEALLAFGSLSDLASPDSSACLAFATITYANGERGLLLVVKPNVCVGLPIDLENFKQATPEFPQQGTADQFFSEAQWESYFQLGRFLGGKLSCAFIAQLLARPQDFFEDDLRRAERVARPAGAARSGAAKGATPGAATAAAGTAPASAAASAKPVLGRLAPRISAGAVRTTLGLGALATVGVSLWQGLDSLSTARNKRVADERSGLNALVEPWSKLPAPGADEATRAAPLNALAAALVRTADVLCPGGDASWFKQSPLANHIRDDVLEGCRGLPPARRAAACSLLVEAADERLQRDLPDCLLSLEQAASRRQPGYWIYDYRSAAPFRRAHPCDPVALDHRKAEAGAQARRVALAAGPGEGDADRAAKAAEDAVAPEPQCVAAEASPAPTAGELPASAAASGAASSASVPSPAPSSAPSPAPSPSPAPAMAPASRAASSGAPTPGPRPAPAPTPSPTPAPMPSPAPPSPRALSAAVSTCTGRTIYLQYYGPLEQERAEDLRRRANALGLKVPGAEDVLASADRAGRGRPTPPGTSWVRYHDLDSRECAEAWGRALKGARVEPLATRYRGTPRVVEVWLAPAAAAIR